MLIVNYNPTYGQAVRDGEIAYFAKTIYSRSQMPNKKKKALFSILLSSKAVIKELQKMIAEGKIPPNTIQFKYLNARLIHDAKGSFIMIHKKHELA